MKKILVIGSTVADVIINVDKLPAMGVSAHALSQKINLGGCAYNVSDVIRNFNLPAFFTCRHRYLRRLFKERTCQNRYGAYNFR